MKKISVWTLTLGFLVSLFFVACSNLEMIEEKDDNGNIVLKYTRNKETLAKEGVLTRFWENGDLMETANYVNDTLHGERKIYTNEGKLEISENYVQGNFEGTYTKYYQNGQILQQGEYENNKMTGIWKGFYDNGNLREEVLFENNSENGPFKEYHSNGEIAVEGTLNGSFEVGELLEYDRNGELKSKKKCRKGVCQTFWTKEEGDIPIDEEKFNQLVDRVKALEDN